MKTYNYMLTLTANQANLTESLIATISPEELIKLKDIADSRNYILNADKLYECSNVLPTFKETKQWVKETKLYKVDYVLHRVLVDVIHLPEGIQFNSAGYLEIVLGKDFTNLHHDGALKENELSQWILKTFPTAEYCCSRSKFTLPTKREEYADKRHTIKYVFSVSSSSNEAVEVTKRIYKKTFIEL